jgi:diaminohydroxyphosphoribosylaminopyrimidine deaminase/5-amino-6-(5-phosphoribosylamino)uracil reductase
MSSQLVCSAPSVPVLVAVSEHATASKRDELATAGCEVVVCPGTSQTDRLNWLLDELGRRQMTNILVEGGSTVLGSFFDLGQIDEVHVFIAPKLFGGDRAPGAIGGNGVDLLSAALRLTSPQIERCGSDIYVHGRVAR